MLEKQNCKCGQHDFDLLTNQNMIINGPDIHQQIVNKYIKYSRNYWINVKKRQLEYLANRRSNITGLPVIPKVVAIKSEPLEFIVEKPKNTILNKQQPVQEVQIKNISCWAKCIY